MKVTQLGPDTPYDLKDLGTDWVHLIHWYEQGYYEGDGQAVAWDGEKFYVWSLCHCSCYGPCEGSPTVYSLAAMSKMVYDPDVLAARDLRSEIVEFLTTTPLTL